jgi:RNA polymerase sigma factor (sigma-70 family)
MATSRQNVGVGDFRALFQVGSFVGLSDAELLERYVTGCDGIAETAFAVLVERHGSLVVHVCNDVLNDPHAAQDAAQVTFLVLARRAGAIRRRNSLASWLFGVARRVAARAKVEAARRRAHERRRAEMATREHDRRPRAPVTGEPWAELFEEIDRLSERHRSAIVLCDLEGLTHEQAAQRLGCPIKTVQGRLYRARELLRHRLSRRGVTATAGMAGIALAQRTASAAPSAAWVQETARAAAQLASGQGVERFLSVESAELFRHVSRGMIMTNLKIAVLGGLVLATTAGGMGIAWNRIDNVQVADQPPRNGAPPVAAAAPRDPAAAPGPLALLNNPPDPRAAAPLESASVQMKVANNLKQVGLAMHNYPKADGRFPAPATKGPDGKPLLSWRVAILPYLNEGELYQSFKLDEPWDSPNNKPLLERMPYLFASAPQRPGQAQGNLTHFRVFVGEGTPFEGGRGPRSEDFPDGPDRTILIVEADEAVPWTKPDDLPYAPDKPLPSLGKGPRGNFLVMMADGSVRFIPAKFDEVLLRRAITRNDKQPLDIDRLGTFDPPLAPPKAQSGQDTNRSTTGPPADRGAGQTGTPRSVERIALGGRVLDPDGKPFAGAAVYFVRPAPFVFVPHPRPPRRPEPKAMSQPDGRFAILIDLAEWDDMRSIPNRFGPHVRTFPLIAAVAPRYGPSWVLLPKPEAQADVTLQLVKDDVPIEGRILDLEGRPVPGATVTTDEIIAAPGEDLTPVIKSLNSGMAGDMPPKFLAASIAGLPQTLTTDREGRFRLTGIGRERAVFLDVSGPTIQSSGMFVMTRLEFQVARQKFERPKLPLADSPSIGAGPMKYPARLEHAVGPTKPIEGVVRDGATGRPLPGAVITTAAVYVRDGRHEGWGGLGGGRATADAQGRFRIVGARKSRDLGIFVFPPEGQPYLERIEHVGDTPGLAPIVHEVSLTRGIPVRGRLIDQVSRRPVRGVVHYFLLTENPRYNELRWSLSFCQVPTGDDGAFSIVGLDGPGLLAASAHSDRFTKGVGVDRFKLAKPLYNSYGASPVNADPRNLDTLVELNLPADSSGVERTIELIPSK